MSVGLSVTCHVCCSVSQHYVTFKSVSPRSDTGPDKTASPLSVYDKMQYRTGNLTYGNDCECRMTLDQGCTNPRCQIVEANSEVCVFSAYQIYGASNCELASIFCLDSLCSHVSVTCAE